MFLPLKAVILSLSSAAVLAEARSGRPHGNPHTIRWVDCARHVPESTAPTGGSFNSSTVNLATLPSALHCGQIDVPMDYSKPFCEDNKITLGLATYRPPKPKGPLFFCPGGTDPGVVTIWEAALNISDAFTGLLDFELVAMDIRGTFSSNQLNVSLPLVAALEEMSYPASESDYEAIQAASAAAIQSWIDNSTPAGIIQHVGTREVTQDYEMIRKALGHHTINFIGASYGSFRAQQYAATFPERVGLFVLDAVVPHGRSFFDQGNDDIAAQNWIIQRADAYCLNDTTCPFYGQGKGSVIKALKELIAAVDPVTSLGIRSAMTSLIAESPDFPYILQAIKNALNGDFSLFASPPQTAQEMLEESVAQPLICSDNDFPKSFEYFNNSLAVGLSNDITGIGMTATWLIMTICSAWTFPVPPAISQPLHLEAPMLLVTADFDASAVTDWTTFTWGQIPNGVLVDRHGDDHVSLTLVDQPSTKIMKEYLNTGKLPPAQNSTFVTVYTPGMVRGPIEDPYLVPTGAKAGDVDSGEIVQEPF